MPQLCREVVEQFEQQCIWAHQSWQTRVCLFDTIPNLAMFQQPHYEHFFHRLSIILQEYWMQQVAKLHDPSGSSGQHNLSVDYILERGDWSADTKALLTELRDKMLPFAAKMKTPRNKLLAHNDVSAILSATELGAFDQGEDVEYFKNLRTFTETVVTTALGQHFFYDNKIPADIDLFAQAFDRGRIGGDRAT